jgi:hypothetical protein
MHLCYLFQFSICCALCQSRRTTHAHCFWVFACCISNQLILTSNLHHGSSRCAHWPVPRHDRPRGGEKLPTRNSNVMCQWIMHISVLNCRDPTRSLVRINLGHCGLLIFFERKKSGVVAVEHELRKIVLYCDRLPQLCTYVYTWFTWAVPLKQIGTLQGIQASAT